MWASVLLLLFFLWAWVCGSFLRQCVRILRGICATFSIESRLLVCHLSIDQIELKRDAVPEVVLNNLFQKTQLQSSFSGNFLAIVNSGSTPGRFTLRESLEQFLACGPYAPSAYVGCVHAATTIAATIKCSSLTRKS